MKQIKFRIFLGENYFYWGFVKHGKHLVFNGLPSDIHDTKSLEEIQEKSQQYSNRRDKNDVNICEGDYVGHVIDGKIVGTIMMVKHGEYDNDEKYGDNISGNGWYLETDGFILPFYIETYTEVVGNINEGIKINNGE